jgi:hypothetical protein
LVAKLDNPLVYKGLVNMVIFIHRLTLSRANDISTNN